MGDEQKVNRENPLFPPRLTMEEYARFIDWSIRQMDPEKARKQKELEERSIVRFRFVEKAETDDL